MKDYHRPCRRPEHYLDGVRYQRVRSAMAAIPGEVVAAANARSRRLRELLLAPEILIMPGAYDVLSARLFEAMGFPAIQGTSGGIAAVHGLYDEELLGRDGVVAIYRELAAAVS